MLKEILNMIFGAKRIELKVKRGDLAKRFEILHVAKHGDVGLDVAVALPFKEGYEKRLEQYYEDCVLNDEELDENLIQRIMHEQIVVNPGERVLIPTDIRLEIPKGYWVAVEARSSTSKKSLIVPKGVIDEGYRGEIFAQIVNVGKEKVIINDGDRLIQLILQKNYTNRLDITEVEELSESERGETGFGSTGQSSKEVNNNAKA